MIAKAARRYANALLETAIELDILEEVKKDMQFVKNTVDQSKDLRIFLKSPVIKPELKKAALHEIFDGRVSDISMKLIKILSSKKRENLLLDITKGFMELYNNHHGIIEVNVSTAFDLTAELNSELHKKLESTTGKKVELITVTNKDLIGGLTVRIDDTVIDGSVKYKLNQLKDKFTASAV
ncbi:MAG: ATP synthase F1 subunit delta [Balneolaceae bacterium]